MKVYVSLTSIVDNLPSLYHTLGSLLNQSYKADIYLFLSPMPYLQDTGFTGYRIPEWLDSMPIEIRWVNNIGPYRKLLPLLNEVEEDDIIITCDDDTIYDKDFVKGLVETYMDERCCVAYRCKLWIPGCKYFEMKDSELKSVSNFHTGKGGVLYTPKMFHGCDIMSDRFLKICPTNDDFWFNFWRMKNNIPCFHLKQSFMIEDLHNAKTALYNNYNEKTNDSQMIATYKYVFQVDEEAL